MAFPVSEKRFTARAGKEEHNIPNVDDYVAELVSTVPLCKGLGGFSFFKYENFYYPKHLLPAEAAIRHSFEPRPSDVILATAPKSGTTWLKAIIFSTVHRARLPPPSDPRHPLLASSPHDLFPFLHTIYQNSASVDQARLACEAIPPPRLLATHSPFSCLPASLAAGSACKIVYLCRDPKDAFVSLRYYLGDAMKSFAEDFELLCEGVYPFGPLWDHFLEYWRESRRRPAEVLFLKYEEVKADTAGHVRKLAEFLGCPLSAAEEEGGVAAEIARLCSFERMKSTAAADKGMHGGPAHRVKNSAFFRKGEVGDWKEHMTAEMAERLDRILEEKLQGSGLTFK